MRSSEELRSLFRIHQIQYISTKGFKYTYVCIWSLPRTRSPKKYRYISVHAAQFSQNFDACIALSRGRLMYGLIGKSATSWQTHYCETSGWSQLSICARNSMFKFQLLFRPNTRGVDQPKSNEEGLAKGVIVRTSSSSSSPGHGSRSHSTTNRLHNADFLSCCRITSWW